MTSALAELLQERVSDLLSTLKLDITHLAATISREADTCAKSRRTGVRTAFTPRAYLAVKLESRYTYCGQFSQEDLKTVTGAMLALE
jgi:hypothetical protein